MSKEARFTNLTVDITLFFIIFTTVFVPFTVETGKKPAEKIGLFPSKQANREKQKRKKPLIYKGFLWLRRQSMP